jgi:hypothetical protein
MTPKQPDLSAVQERLLSLLKERRTSILACIRPTADRGPHEDYRACLTNARLILYQIAGTAGLLGLTELGKRARNCEDEIAELLIQNAGISKPIG